MLETLSLEGKSVLVTGGGSGLGREIVMALVYAGADVAIAGRRLDRIERVASDVKKLGRSGLAVQTDVTDSIQVRHMFERVIDGLGKLDVLVNNAGMIGLQGDKPIWEVSDEEFRNGIDSNLTGAFYCSRSVAYHMVGRGSGKIINVSSGFGLRGGRDNYAYACSKGGVVQLTRTLATSLGRYGITSTCIVPGYFPTEGTVVSQDSLPRPEFIPVGRLGNPAEIGPIAVFLASSASDYMSGTIFPVDGGALAGGYAPTTYAPVTELELLNGEDCASSK